MPVALRETYPRWVGASARGVLKLLGWRLLGERPEVPKCVILAAPHTTNWDFFFFLLASFGYRLPAMFTMKKFWFFWPLGTLWRWLGGVAVDRSKRANAVDQMIDAFGEHDVLRLTMQPEGTRKHVEYWKTGFYWVARGAGVPILMGHIDYRNKEVALSTTYAPTGDPEVDLGKICAYYKDVVGLAPKFRDQAPPTTPELNQLNQGRTRLGHQLK